MPSGHVTTGGAPQGTGKDYLTVLLLTTPELWAKPMHVVILILYTVCKSSPDKAMYLSRNSGLLPLQSLSRVPGAAQGKMH